MSEQTGAQIVVMRHGQKDGEGNLTVKGARQVAAAVRQLAERGFQFERLIFSGAERTRQSALVTAAMLDLDLPLEEDNRFHFQTAFEQALDGKKAAFLAEAEKVRRAGGMVAQALELSTFARLGRELLQNALRGLTMDMVKRDQLQTMVLSHSPWAELAAVTPSEMPYGLGEADAVYYVVNNGEIVVSDLIKAPLPGAANV